jgi:hypothetical protein
MGGNLHRLKNSVSLFRSNDLRGRFLRSDGDEVPLGGVLRWKSGLTVALRSPKTFNFKI